MPVLIGELEKITGSPSSVTQVIVRAHTTRITGSALTTDELVPIPVDRQGRFEVPLRPGKAVLVLVHGGRVGEGERFPMLVEEGLGTITSAIKLASDRFDDYELDELERAAADMLAHIDKAAVSATQATVSKEAAEKERAAAEKARQGAETIEQGIPDKVNQELATQLPGELDERVPPLVAESIADDRAVADAAAAAVEGAVNDAVDAGLPGKADTSYVDAQDQALGARIDDAHWYRGGLGSSDSLDDYRGLADQGLYRVTPSVGGGTGLAGWVEVTYDGNSARTRQVFTASSPSEYASLERKYSDGRWRDWSPVTWHGVVVSSGSADDLITPHVYAISAIGLAGLPTDTHGSLEVLPAGADSLSLTQIFTSSESTPRTWKRTRRAGQWNEWVQLATGQDVEDIVARQSGDTVQYVEEFVARQSGDTVQYVEEFVARQLGDLDIPSALPPLLMLATETPSDSGARIVNSWSNDGTVGYNALAAAFRQTLDEGATWEDVRTFGGNYVEWSRMLPNGELMVSTSGSVGGVSGRRVWISTGYTAENPTAATWDVVLMPHAPYVKFADWSISITDEMVLLAEYGPKSGVSWGSVSSIPEGQNARYIYQSTDNGRTWSTIFDLNDFLLSNGRASADGQHLHGVAWDKYWSRIWVSFGDATGNGSNGVLYSDDRGGTWEVAYWTHTHTSLGWQVVGIQPMRDTVLFAGDMTPSGVIALDRADGRDAFNFYTAWDFSDEDKHLCHVIEHKEGLHGEIALLAFAREGTASPSFVLGTRDGRAFEVLWQEEGASLPGIRSLAGPSADGTVIASVNTADGWMEVKGKLTLYGTPWRDDAGAAALRELGGKADKAAVDSADRELSDQITALENLIGASKAKAGQVPKWDGHQFGWSWMDQHPDLYDDSY